MSLWNVRYRPYCPSFASLGGSAQAVVRPALTSEASSWGGPILQMIVSLRDKNYLIEAVTQKRQLEDSSTLLGRSSSDLSYSLRFQDRLEAFHHCRETPFHVLVFDLDLAFFALERN